MLQNPACVFRYKQNDFCMNEWREERENRRKAQYAHHPHAHTYTAEEEANILYMAVGAIYSHPQADTQAQIHQRIVHSIVVCTRMKRSSVCMRDAKSYLNRPQSHIPLEHQRNFISDSSWAQLSWSVLFWIFVFKHVQFHCSVSFNRRQEIRKNGLFIVLIFLTPLFNKTILKDSIISIFSTAAVTFLCLLNCSHRQFLQFIFFSFPFNHDTVWMQCT